PLDRGATWAVQSAFQGHRHAHGLMPDPARHALFAFFGDFDNQSGLFRSTDGGASWTMIIGNTQAGDIVDGVVLSDGSFLCGQDISYRGSIPDTPQIARVALDGTETDYQQLPTASYSTHAISAGGYVVGATYETSNDSSPPGGTRGSLAVALSRRPRTPLRTPRTQAVQRCRLGTPATPARAWPPRSPTRRRASICSPSIARAPRMASTSPPRTRSCGPAPTAAPGRNAERPLAGPRSGCFSRSRTARCSPTWRQALAMPSPAPRTVARPGRKCSRSERTDR